MGTEKDARAVGFGLGGVEEGIRYPRVNPMLARGMRRQRTLHSEDHPRPQPKWRLSMHLTSLNGLNQNAVAPREVSDGGVETLSECVAANPVEKFEYTTERPFLAPQRPYRRALGFDLVLTRGQDL